MEEKNKAYIEMAIWIIIIILALYVGTQVGLRMGLTENREYIDYLEMNCICPKPIEKEMELVYPINISK